MIPAILGNFRPRAIGLYHRALMLTHQVCPQTPGGRSPIPAMRQSIGLPVFLMGGLLALIEGHPAWAITDECNTEDKMAQCCSLYEKSLHERIYQAEQDLADQCRNEIDGTRDQLSENGQFDTCIPSEVGDEELSKYFRGYVANHRDFWDRPARFGMIEDWSLHWPCDK